jgi:putative acetyltransferase
VGCLGGLAADEEIRAHLLIRAEAKADRAAIRAINTEAFETAAEAKLVEALRERARPVVSLVAEHEHKIVGHIMFSPVVHILHVELKIMGLAPMAVAPPHQRKGVGSSLVRAGLEQCTRLGFGAVVVLGHPTYYPRFGFVPASRWNIRCEYDAPPEAFMAIELQAGYLNGKAGTIQYHPAFADV